MLSSSVSLWEAVTRTIRFVRIPLACESKHQWRIRKVMPEENGEAGERRARSSSPAIRIGYTQIQDLSP